MSPVAVERPEWESALSTRRLLPSGDDSKAGTDDEEASPMKSMEESFPADAGLQLVPFSTEARETGASIRESSAPATPSNSALAASFSPEALPQSRAQSTSPGRSLIPPIVATSSEAEHKVGNNVLYWSGTHSQWMDAVVTRLNFDTRGCVLSYDLDVKRGALATKIRKAASQSADGRPLLEQGNQSLLPASIQKVPTPVSNKATGDPSQPQVAAGSSAVANAAADRSSSNGQGGSGGAPLGTTPMVAAVPPTMTQSAVPKLTTSHSGAGTPGGGSLAPTGIPTASRQEPPPEASKSKEESLAMRRFEIGERVEYWSGTYSQWMQARIERVRTDGITYDLDVKRGAQRRRMRSLRRSDASNCSTSAAAPAAPTASAGSNNLGTAVVPPPVSKAAPKAKPTSPVRAAGRNVGAGNAGLATGSTAPAPEPRSAGRDAVPSSRLRGVSREPVPAEVEEITAIVPVPKQTPPVISGAGPGVYPRSGSPFLNEKHLPPPPHEKALSGASQTAPAGDTVGVAPDGRPRLHSAGAVTVGKSRQDLGRPGPVTSGSVGLTAVATGPGTGVGVQLAPVAGGLLGGAKAGGQPRRFLPDSSAGPTIGTRPENVLSGGTSPASTTAEARSPLNRVGATGHVTVNGVMKKVGPNGYVAGGSGTAEKVMVQRDADKVVVRQPLVGGGTTLFSSSSAKNNNRPAPLTSSTGSTSETVPAAIPSLRSAAVSKAPAVDLFKAPPTEERQRRETLTGMGGASGTSSAGGALEGLDATPAELAVLAQQIGAEIDMSEPAGPKVQVAVALSRLPVSELMKRSAEAQIDTAGSKDKKELENLLAHALITRQRSGSGVPERQRANAAAAPPVPPPELAPPATVARRTPAAGTAGAGAAIPVSSSLVATGITASVLEKPELEVGELDIGSGPFDPTQASVMSQLTTALGYSENSTIEEMTGFRGGLNEGVWFLSDVLQSPPRRDLVLKLVKCHRISASILTEAENFVKIAHEHPRTAQDHTVAFPVRIFKCLGPAPERAHRHDLVVMWKVKGERMAESIAHKWYQKQFDKLWEAFEKLGEALAAFHQRYDDSQHGDFQPSNVFYDEETGDISLIDIGGMGVPTATTDKEHFNKSLKLLADVYGSQLMVEGAKSFEAGYSRMRSR